MTTGILKYRLVELKYPINDPETPETRWYARAVQDRTIDFEDFVTHMSEHNSPYSRGVIHGVLIDMLSCLQELVLDGKSVRLGDLGLFSLGISGEGAPTRDVYNPTNYVKDVHLNVRNTKTWSNAELRSIKYYTKTESINSEIEEALRKAPSKSGGEGANYPDIKCFLETLNSATLL